MRFLVLAEGRSAWELDVVGVQEAESADALLERLTVEVAESDHAIAESQPPRPERPFVFHFAPVDAFGTTGFFSTDARFTTGAEAP